MSGLRPDITRAKQVLGWQPEVSLEDGLNRLLSALGSREVSTRAGVLKFRLRRMRLSFK